MVGHLLCLRTLNTLQLDRYNSIVQPEKGTTHKVLPKNDALIGALRAPEVCLTMICLAVASADTNFEAGAWRNTQLTRRVQKIITPRDLLQQCHEVRSLICFIEMIRSTRCSPMYCCASASGKHPVERSASLLVASASMTYLIRDVILSKKVARPQVPRSINGQPIASKNSRQHRSSQEKRRD